MRWGRPWDGGARDAVSGDSDTNVGVTVGVLPGSGRARRPGRRSGRRTSTGHQAERLVHTRYRGERQPLKEPPDQGPRSPRRGPRTGQPGGGEGRRGAHPESAGDETARFLFHCDCQSRNEPPSPFRCEKRPLALEHFALNEEGKGDTRKKNFLLNKYIVNFFSPFRS